VRDTRFTVGIDDEVSTDPMMDPFIDHPSLVSRTGITTAV